MKQQLLLLGFALGLSLTASASSYSVTTSTGGGCTQNEDTAMTVEWGTEMDALTQHGKVFAKWVYKVPLVDTNKIDCTTMYNNEVTKQSMELERMQMEIAVLRKQLIANKSPVTGDDW